METFLSVIGSEEFIAFISTFGLAVLLVLYFVFIRDPKIERYWQKKYDQLIENWQHKYDDLSENYNKTIKILTDIESHADNIWEKQCPAIRVENSKLAEILQEMSETYKRLENDLRPETRLISDDQAIALANLGLDRDLYKLTYYMREKLAGRRDEDIGFFIRDSILETNKTWNKFINPIPKYERIGILFDTYENNGGTLENRLTELLEHNNAEDDAMKELWNMLVNSTVGMKRHFSESIRDYPSGENIVQYDPERSGA